MSTFVIVPGAWDTPLTMEPVIEPLGSAGHDVIVVDLPCGSADATLEEYADAVRAVLPDDLTQVVLVGSPFLSHTSSRRRTGRRPKVSHTVHTSGQPHGGPPADHLDRVWPDTGPRGIV